MSFLKKTSKSRASTTTIIVAGGDQALATGNLVGTGTALGIANAQLGVLSYDFNGTKKLGTFLASGDTSSNVQAIKLVGGTPASANTQTADLWEVRDQHLIESATITPNKIRSVYTRRGRFGQYGGEAVTAIPTIVDNAEYTAKIRLLSVTNDRDYGDNDEVLSFSVPATNFTALGITQTKDYVVQNLVDQINNHSKVASQNSAFRRGNRNLVAFGIKAAGNTATPPTVPTIVLTGGVITSVTGGTGGSGYTTAPTVTLSGGTPSTAGSVVAIVNAAGAITGYTIVSGGAGYGSAPTAALSGGVGVALGSVTVGTSVNFINKQGTVSTFVFDIQAVTALAQLMNSNLELVPASTIETVNIKNAGVQAVVDSFVVLGLPRTTAAYYDNIEQVQTRVEVNLGGKFLTSATKPTTTMCFPDEGTGQGSKLSIMSRDRYLLGVHTMQNTPKGDWFSEGKDYINPAQLYTTYIIEHYDTENVLNTITESPKVIYLLFPCEKASAFTPTVTNIATRIAAGNTPVSMVTSNGANTGTASANTVAGVVAVLDNWLETARVKFGFDLGGDATAGGPYLV